LKLILSAACEIVSDASSSLIVIGISYYFLTSTTLNPKDSEKPDLLLYISLVSN